MSEKDSRIEIADKIFDELIEKYKKNPNDIKHKKSLIQIVYHAFVFGYSTDEKYQDKPLSYLRSFDVMDYINCVLCGNESNENDKQVLNYYDEILHEAKNYYEKENVHFSVLFYAIYIEHWFNDLINVLSLSKNLDEKTSKKIIMSSVDDKLSYILPIFDLPQFSNEIKKDISKIFELRNSFAHYKWQLKTDEEHIKSIQEYGTYAEKAPEIIEYLNRYLKENLFTKQYLKRIFSALIFNQTGIKVEDDYNV